MPTNNRTIAPDYSHRFPIREIRDWYGDLDVAFAAGDYNLVAVYAPPASELKGIGLVMSGLFRQGFEVLEALGTLSPRGHLFRGFAHWLSGRSSQAMADLACVRPESGATYRIAESLTRAIETPDIAIFTISVTLPIFAKEAENARKPVVRYGQFVVKHVASQLAHNAYSSEYHLTEPFDVFIDRLPPSERPRFIFSMSPQWILPQGYERVTIPKVMWCHDTDLFLYRGFDNFRLNDLNVVSTSQEHFELSRSLGVPCMSNMMSDTLCMPAKDARLVRKKDIDLLFTGSAVSSFHSEKSRFLYYASKLSDEFVIKIVDGHLPEGEYHRLIERTRFVPVVNRYAGAVSPRWHEALSRSAMLLYPEGTPFGEAAAGTFPFDTSRIESELRRHLRARRDTAGQAQSPYNAEAVFPLAERSLAPVREPRERQVERQLRYCVLALLLREQDGKEMVSPEPVRRLTWYVPPIDGTLWGAAAVKNRMLSIANAVQPQGLRSDIDVNNLALVYTQILHALEASPEEQALCLARRRSILQEGLSRFPRSLLLKFNRLHWDFMLDVVEARAPAGQTISGFRSLLEEFDGLLFEAVGSDLGIAYTLLHVDHVFPYYDYGQLMVRHCVHARTPGFDRGQKIAAPRDVVRAAIHGFIGWGLLLSGAQPGARAFDEALDQFATSLRVFDDNLPLLRMHYRTLSEGWRAGASSVDAGRLVDAFFAYANKFPTALMTDLSDVLSAVEQLGEHGTLRRLLADWHSFARCTEFVHGDDARVRLRRLLGIVRYSAYFPDSLKHRLSEIRVHEIDLARLSRYERELVAALRYWELSESFDMTIDEYISPIDASERIARLEIELKECRAALAAVQGSRVMRTARWVKRNVFGKS